MFEQEGTFHYVHNSRNRKGHAASDEHWISTYFIYTVGIDSPLQYFNELQKIMAIWFNFILHRS
jgi:hypothetical protein